MHSPELVHVRDDIIEFLGSATFLYISGGEMKHVSALGEFAPFGATFTGDPKGRTILSRRTAHGIITETC